MSQIISTPDGVEHEFPDDASDDIIKKTLKSYSSGPGVPLTSSPAGGSPPANPAPTAQEGSPSFLSRMVSGFSGQPRIFNNALTGGLWDVGVGGAKSLFGAGSVRDEQAKTDAAKTAAGWPATTALDVAGTLAGPGKLSVAGKLEGLLPRILASGGENAALSGFQSDLKGDDVTGNMVKSGGIGMLGPVAGGIAAKIGSVLPEYLGGKAEVPTSAGILKAGGGKFLPQASLNRMDKLSNLESMQSNADTGSVGLPSQIGSFLKKDIDTGTSHADINKFTPDEQGKLADVGSAAPVSGFMYRHPFLTHGALEGAVQIPALALGASGDVTHALEASGLGITGHVGSYILSQKLAAAATQGAFDDAKRFVGGVPTNSPVQDAFNSSEWRKAIQALLFSQSRQ